MAVGLVDRPGRLAQIMEVAELVGDAVEGLLDRLADRGLAIGETPAIGTFRASLTSVRSWARSSWVEESRLFWSSK